MRVIVHYKPSRPTRSLELGKDPTTGKLWRRLFTANSTRGVDQVEGNAIQAAAKAAGIIADFAFQIVQDVVETAARVDLPELSIREPVTEAVGNLLDPDGDGKLGKARPKGGAVNSSSPKAG